MVFQQYALWPHMTVAKNISYPLERHGIAATDRERCIRDITKLVGIEALTARYPAQISGGQQQRVALARALVNEPPVLLLDEPLSNLDASLRAQLRRELRQLHERLGMTTVLVTHDQEEAAAVADVVVVMLNGAILQTGPYEQIMASPRNGFVAKFVGYDNLMPVTNIRHEHGRTFAMARDGSEIRLERQTEISDSPMVIALRGDALRLHRIGNVRPANAISARVKRITSLGHSREFELDSGGFDIVVRMRIAEAPAVVTGDDLYVEIPAQSPLVPAD
ncbi:ABC-type Fe3+/spermidine/putrescine transport system ATPase subunit [Neorhizobium galegae]|nr:ABC-type Fe3+/spermidine/putrescine transport system ATPase subunit [Neorhizobium galegae]